MAGALYALLLAAGVIWVAGYYRSPALLAGQLLYIAAPTVAPFAVLTLGRDRWHVPGSIGLALLLAAGWGYVAWIDAQPYRGGGASLAPVLGWMTAGAAATLTLAAVLVDRARSAWRDPRWRT